MRQITQANIKIYDFPDESSFVFEEKDKKEIRNLKSRVPFAVVGSNTLIEPATGDGKRIRGRKYPWGVVDVSLNRANWTNIAVGIGIVGAWKLEASEYKTNIGKK